MDTALTIWFTVAAVCAMALLYKMIKSLHQHGIRSHRNKFVEIGKESEELFVPGDRTSINDYECDYDD